MKAEDFKTKSKDELTKLVLDLRKEQMNLRFQRAGGQLENTARMRIVRKNIARAKTILTQMEQGTVKAAATKAASSPAAAKKKKSA